VTPTLVVTRPEPGNSETVTRATALGLAVERCPFFEIAPIAWSAPDIAGFDGILLTSANAVQFGGISLDALRSIPAYCVGEATAAAAKRAKLDIAAVGHSNVEALLGGLPVLNLLHLCGLAVTEAPTGSVRIVRLPVYDSKQLDAGPLNERLADRDLVVALHSPRAAETLAALAIDRSRIAIAAISRATAECAGTGWKAVAIADKPRDEEILAAAARLLATQDI
jgi:uroporphyrinogen-III synthase